MSSPVDWVVLPPDFDTPPTDEAPPAASPTSGALLVEVTFKGNRRDFFTWKGEGVPALKTTVVVEVERGEDIGTIYATGELAQSRRAGTTHGRASTDPLKAMLRVASTNETAKGVALRADEETVRRRAIDMVRAQNLEMKVSDVEWQFDKKRLTVYFTADKRVDFRQLVRQLEQTFSTRVQMWHIGVRDEARRLDGVGRCGRQFCSASWLPDLRPVKSSVAKDQRLSTLNPAQISGTCGRLMCCLRYEHEFYVAQRKRFPKEGKILTTAPGEEKVVANDIFREQVTLRNPTGETRTIPLAQLNRELGGEIMMQTAEFAIPDDEGDDEEIGFEGEAPRRMAAPPPRPAPRPERSEWSEPRAERPERPSRPERSERPPRGERPAQPPRAERPPRPERKPEDRPRPQQPPRPPATPAPASATADGAEPAGTEGGEPARRRRRRGRRGGRRGKDGKPDGGASE
jgi:cell fate regulator YaaT (PSP1 superfamily)